MGLLRLLALCVLITVAVVAFLGVGGGGGRRSEQQASRAPRPVQLPRGGRTILPGHFVVAYYGIVGTSNILGHTNNPEADARGVEKRAQAYAHYGWPVQPAFELVATVASPDAGPDGTYSSPVDPATVQRYLDAAHRHKLLLILDFQPGQGQFLPDVKHYQRFLLDPSVGVGLDPEWKLAPGQLPGSVIGSASAASINAVSDYLSGLVAKYQLPQKLLVIHEFLINELPDRQLIAMRPGLATVLQMDGFGPVGTKLDAFRSVTAGAGRFHIGFKIFLHQDTKPMTPQQVMALRPRPVYISYQ